MSKKNIAVQYLEEAVKDLEVTLTNAICHQKLYASMEKEEAKTVKEIYKKIREIEKIMEELK